MKLNNFIRIEIPFISKGLFDKKFSNKYKGYEYKGTAHYVINKEDKRIVFETAKLDENQIILGAANYRDGHLSKSYISSKINWPLKKTRLEMFGNFNWSYEENGICHDKPTTKFKGNISELNNLIISNGITIKTVVGYISGSNAGGGLAKPESDEIGAIWNEDPLKDIYKQDLIEGVKFWKIFSSITAISNKESNNTKFIKNFTWDKLFEIEKVGIEWLFENDYKIIPWGKTMFEEDYVEFKRGIASQNRNFFIEKYDDWDYLLFNERYWKSNEMDRLKEHIEKVNWKRLSNELRAIWTRKVNNNISANSYIGDFIKNKNRFKKCHIIENKEAKMLFDNSIIWEEKEKFIKSLLNENNYVLLEGDLHDHWDNTKSISINSNGEIENNSLSQEDFNDLVGSNSNIYKIYPNVNNKIRKKFIEYRYNK